MTWSFGEGEHPPEACGSVGPGGSSSNSPGSLELGIKKPTNTYVLLINKYSGEKYGKHTVSKREIIVVGNLP